MIDVSISVAFDENSQDFYNNLKELINEHYPSVDLVAYHEGLRKDRRKAFMLKGGYSTKLSPFAVIFDLDRNPLKAFYTDVKECTVENIQSYLDSILTQLKQNENESSSN